MLPYIETIAQSDAKIVFLVHYAARGVDNYIESFCHKHFASESSSRNRGENEPIEPSTKGAAKTTSASGVALARLAARTEVAVYAGKFHRAVTEYMRKENVQFVVVLRERSCWLQRLWRKLFFLERPFNVPTLPPVVLYFRKYS